MAALLASLQAARHSLLPWAEYWDLTSRLREAGAEEVEAFYQRWPASYLEDRLRNDWLLELGRRRDFPAIAREYPRFRMDDDREVRCWFLLTEHLAGKDVTEAARAAWMAQREADDGCNMLATAMVDARRFSQELVWQKARLAIEQQRPAAARAAVGLLGNAPAAELSELLLDPGRWLRRHDGSGRQQQELRTLALIRVSSADPSEAAPFLSDLRLSGAQSAWVHGWLGRQTALRLLPESAALYQRALAELRSGPPGWSDETLAWGVRSALRHAPAAARWPMVLRLVDAMSPKAQQEPAWAYWKAMALRALAREGSAGDAGRDESRRLLAGLAGPLDFYALLAAEALGQSPAWPAEPAPITAAEQQAAVGHAGLQRAMLLLSADLRSEGWREWNYSLRSMGDRELLAAARMACDQGHWQLCINTAERTRSEIDLALRYPMPYASEIKAAAAATDLDLALVLGLIRQETRFMARLRSHAGATGLMQVMPATAQVVAKKLGLSCCSLGQLGDPQLNLRLGTQYLRWALDDVQGSEPLALAAYNAGPGRPRRWREAATMDAAAFAEGIPFNETRDYVKKVLANAAVYEALLAGKPPSLRHRLGSSIGPREPTAPPPNIALP